VEASLTIRPDLIAQGDFTQEGGRRAMHTLLGLAEPPTAVFVASERNVTPVSAISRAIVGPKGSSLNLRRRAI